MRRRVWNRIIYRGCCLVLFILLASFPQLCRAEGLSEDNYVDELYRRLDLEELDRYISGLSFGELAQMVTENGIAALDGERLLDLAYAVFLEEVDEGRQLFIQLLLLGILFAVSGRFLMLRGQFATQMCFFMIYSMMIVLLMEGFLLAGSIAQDGLAKIVDFLQVLIPSYAATLLLSGNPLSAGMFYEMTFGLILLLEWSMKVFIAPCIHVYVLLELFDHFLEEQHFSRLADLIAGIVRWFRKVAVGGVISVGAIQSLLAPAKDRISQSAVLRGFTILPGVGNGIHLAEEVLLGCGMLVKNSVGVVGVVVLFLVCATPILKLFCFQFLFRLLEAILQPLTDRRILGGIRGAANGCSMYLRVMTDTMLLFLIVIAMVTAATSFVY